jgi:monofunctional biosynthetic peptidoglycan transglycosylase
VRLPRARRAAVLLRWIVAPFAVLFACLAYSWFTLPDVRPLRRTVPERTAFMRLRAAEAADLGRPYRPLRQWLPYNRISPALRRAVLVAEDAGFWDHRGMDYTELRASLETYWARGGTLRGGSTLTQQLAKNLYLSESRNPYRKLVELQIARRLEAELSKTRILELYLNVIEWGDGIWGADAAARAYFKRSASDLTAPQAALMAGAIINPRVYSVRRPNGRLLRRQQIILRRMGQVRPPTTPIEPLVVEEDDEAVPAPPEVQDPVPTEPEPLPQ